MSNAINTSVAQKLISAEAAENIITNALHTAAETYKALAFASEVPRLREQFTRQAQEAETLRAQIEDGLTRIGEPHAHLIKFQAYNAHGPRTLQCICDDDESARTIAQLLRGCGYRVNHQTETTLTAQEVQS